ncbi:hypothetical protein [Gluconacetobacter diazotrophicus]|uniref:hypothetical protein n=1 Tax=Gluconacetobacter diazotrophicus TaxID=33996 RepID=UPI00119D9A75|nr:hypothetical protein [Gluconacetobacter diazotrophicus]
MANIKKTSINTTFNQNLNFCNVQTTSDNNGILQKSLIVFRTIKGRVEQINPVQIFNGVQDQIRAGTTLMYTRFFPELTSTDYVTVNVREAPNPTIVTRTYVINDVSTVDNESRYAVITASLIVPNSQGLLDAENGTTPGSTETTTSG